VSKFERVRKEIEPDVAECVDFMQINGTTQDLMALFGTLTKMQPAANGDANLTLTNAMICEAGIKRWLKAFEARCDEAEARLN
jgi:hypothetical protein